MWTQQTDPVPFYADFLGSFISKMVLCFLLNGSLKKKSFSEFLPDFTDKVGSNHFFRPSSSGFKGFFPWHSCCLAEHPRLTQPFFFSHSYTRISFFYWVFSVFFLKLSANPLALTRSYGKSVMCLHAHWLIHALLGSAALPRGASSLLASSAETLHNWQTCNSVTCENSSVGMRACWGQREQCNSVTEPAWTLCRRHIPEVGQWKAHCVLWVVLPA